MDGSLFGISGIYAAGRQVEGRLEVWHLCYGGVIQTFLVDYIPVIVFDDDILPAEGEVA